MTAKNRTRDEIVRALEGRPGLSLHPDLPLSRWSTFRIGGPADLAVEVSSERALVELLDAVDRGGIEFQLLGLGSNILLPDEGLRGVVARLTGDLRRVRIRGGRLSAGAGAPLAVAARKAAAAGLGGLEALAGFPSTVGGAVFMNAGCYGVEIQDVLTSVRVVERHDAPSGRRHRIATADLHPRYRATDLAQSGAIVTRALFELAPGEPKALLARMEELNAKRWASLPSGQGNAGSTFKNPPGDYAGRLIEAAGLKGAASGGAQISPKHANVIVNAGGASASDVIALMRRARSAVEERFGIRLEPELILMGGLRAELEATSVNPPVTRSDP